jgi:DNA (cytosine-5)-methyltransferase 1
MLTVGSLCSGYEGLGLGLRLAGWPVELAWVADNDPGAARLLAHRYPDVPNLQDVRDAQFSAVQPVDILTAGYPCQPLSLAGRRAGTADERWIWTDVLRAVRMVRPRLVLLENVAGHLSLGFGRVVADLASIGYVGSWACVRASDVGAPHRRNRVFLLARPADSEGIRLGDTGPEGGRRVPAAAVAGGAGADGLNLLPTPAATLGRGTGFPSRETAQDRMGRGTRCLDDAVALLPTPAARDAGRGFGWGDQPGRPLSETIVWLLPTPKASDEDRGDCPSERERRSPSLVSIDHLLPTPAAADSERASLTYARGNPTLIGALLPTPTVADSRSTRNATAGRTPGAQYSKGWTLADIAHDDRWGQYAPAIARWEAILGRPAPDPTEPGSKGQPRLSPRFVEWLMGLADGWVTAIPGLTRNEQLRALGNGVVPQQCAAAISHLYALAGTETDRPA